VRARDALLVAGCAGALGLQASAPVAAAEAGSARSAATVTITIEAMRFEPARVDIRPGDRVVWVNRDPFPHTATAADHAFDSGAIPAGASWAWVASHPGRFAYVCAYHPTMNAIVTVEADSRAP
jgi:plastocyanin